MMDGNGMFHWNNGAKYMGEFSNDLKSGNGYFSYADGVRYYNGEWANDVQHGKGYVMREDESEERYALYFEGKFVKYLDEDMY